MLSTQSMCVVFTLLNTLRERVVHNNNQSDWSRRRSSDGTVVFPGGGGVLPDCTDAVSSTGFGTGSSSVNDRNDDFCSPSSSVFSTDCDEGDKRAAPRSIVRRCCMQLVNIITIINY